MTAKTSARTIDPQDESAATPSEERSIDFDLIELFFFAYRDFTSDPDHMLDRLGFGRAHHRILHFVNRRPGLTVAELLDVLQITKQSLARVLKQLIDTGHVVQVQGPRDRRQRELHLTPQGRALALELAAPQSRRMARALADLQPGDRATVEHFLKEMVNSEFREQVENLGTQDGPQEGKHGPTISEQGS